MLVGLAERGEAPDGIVFADTGGEKPETYVHVGAVDKWCRARGWPGVDVVRHASAAGVVESLEENCLRMGRMPSIAYGYKACSDRWKRRPQERWASTWAPALASWARGEPVTKLIGYDADEPERKQRADELERGPQELARYRYRYPLMEWGWGRRECVGAIARAGLPQPGKSSCFFCPSMRRAEVRALASDHPDLMARALAMEAAAGPSGGIMGLGRRWSWADLVASDAAQGRLFPEPQIEEPCGCYDGGDE
jgi:hypothetical protein